MEISAGAMVEQIEIINVVQSKQFVIGQSINPLCLVKNFELYFCRWMVDDGECKQVSRKKRARNVTWFLDEQLALLLSSLCDNISTARTWSQLAELLLRWTSTLTSQCCCCSVELLAASTASKRIPSLDHALHGSIKYYENLYRKD